MACKWCDDAERVTDSRGLLCRIGFQTDGAPEPFRCGREIGHKGGDHVGCAEEVHPVIWWKDGETEAGIKMNFRNGLIQGVQVPRSDDEGVQMEACRYCEEAKEAELAGRPLCHKGFQPDGLPVPACCGRAENHKNRHVACAPPGLHEVSVWKDRANNTRLKIGSLRKRVRGKQLTIAFTGGRPN